METGKTVGEYSASVQEAANILFQFPGVVRVGFGLKEKENSIVSEYVFRVYVQRKIPSTELTPDQMIPAEINGIKTDVIQLQSHHPASSCKTKIYPGMKITKLAFNVSMESGSIGCFLRRDGDINRYLLTNDHVLVNEEEMDPIEKRVYQPKYKTCAEIECRAPIAYVEQDVISGGTHVKNGGQLNFDFANKKYSIDCRVARIDSDVIARNKIEDIGDLTGFYDLSKAEITQGTPIAVQKKGARTGHTDGIVTELFHVNLNHETIYELFIRPTTTGHVSTYDNTFTFQPADVNDVIARFNGATVSAQKVAGTNDKIHFKGNVFSNLGDSGSAVIYRHEGKNKIVGLVTTGTGGYFNVREKSDREFIPAGNSGAGYILPILNFLRFSDTSLIIPTGDSSGEDILEPGIELEWDQIRSRRLHLLEKKISDTKKGREMIDDLQPHAEEIINLVHHKRPVSLAWYRNKGPAFAGMFIKTIDDINKPFELQIDNIQLLQAANVMYNALYKYGSTPLSRALEKHRAFLLNLFENCTCYEQLVEAFVHSPESITKTN